MLFWWNTPPTPDKIYASSLEPLGLGHPLWIPEPHVSGEPQVGDVGFTWGGRFFRLFHLDASDVEKQVTWWKPAFSVKASQPFPNAALANSIICTENWLARGDYCSRGVYRDSIHASAGSTNLPAASGNIHASYTCKESRGAALTLQSSADCVETMPNRSLKRYILQHHHHWYAYATKTLEYDDLKPEDILVVTGVVKTSHDWASTTFGIRNSTEVAASVEASAAGVAHASIGGSHSTSTSSSPIPRKGSAYSADAHGPAAGTGPRDQCIFYKRLRVRRQLGFLSKMIAGAGPHHPGKEDRRHASSSALAVAHEKETASDDEDLKQESEKNAYDMLDVLLLYILENTAAPVAIAGDDEVECLVRNINVEDFYSYLRRYRPVRVEIVDGCAQLCMEDLIRHQQENRFAHPPIVTTDIANWPHITRKDAGVLTDSQIWLEAMQSKACQVQYKAVIFGDSERMRIDNQHCVSLSADGKLLAAATRNTITIWRLQDGLTVQRLERDGHTKDIWQISFSPDSRHIVSGAEDKVALLWNVKTGNIMRRLMGHEYSVVYTAFSPDGIRIATRSSDSLKIWDASSGNLLHTNTDLGHSGPSTEIRFSPDGSRLMARTSGASREDTAVAVLDCRTGERIATLRKRDILCMAFSPSGDRIATGSEDGSVCVWDAASGKALLVLKEHTYHVWDAAFSPDGGEVATASSDGTVVTCDVRTGKRRFTFRVESVQGKDKKTAWAVAYSPRNKFIACGADDGCVHVWNRTTAAFVAAFQGHRGNARHVIFTMDGWNVMSYGPDRVVRMWSICDALRLS